MDFIKMMNSVFNRTCSWRTSNIKKRLSFSSGEVSAFALDLYSDTFLYQTTSTLENLGRFRNSSKVSIRNVCLLSGRSASVLRKFRISRINFRTLALSGKLPGIKKASW